MAKPETGLRNAFNRQPRGLRMAGLALAGGLALSSCSSNKPSDESTSAPVIIPGATSTKLPKVTFDDRNGGPPKINVYYGPLDTPEDRTSVGEYKSGKSLTALCQYVGRMVYTHPEQGEDRDSSPIWVRVEQDTDVVPGEPSTAWAAGVYLHKPLPHLGNCAG
jgi:hypothetical protein